MRTQKDIRSLFKDRKVPLTHQRLAVYEELASRTDHPSAESLYDSLKANYPSLSLATVYKTLQTLHAMKLAVRVASPSAQARYDARTAIHHHVVCSSCGSIADVFDKKLDSLSLPQLEDYTLDGYSVHFHGLCAHCAKVQDSKTR